MMFIPLIIYNRFICFVSFLPVEPIVLSLAVVERGEPLGFLNILIHYLMSTVSFFRFVYNSLTQRRFHFSCLKVRVISLFRKFVELIIFMISIDFSYGTDSAEIFRQVGRRAFVY